MEEARRRDTPVADATEFERLCEKLAHQGPWLIVAAHPDDETIGASWLMQRAHVLTVLHLTDGAPEDPALRSCPGTRDAYAALRRGESERALAHVVGPRLSRRSLDLPDQRLADALERAVYAVAALLAELSPALLVCHPYEGGHPDHDASAFVARAARELAARSAQLRPALWEMSSYHGAQGTLRTGCFLPSQVPEWHVTLDAVARRRKCEMLAAYASQSAVLQAFGTDEERYRVAPPADFARPPHAGPLHYERLGWQRGEHFRELVAQACTRLGLEPGGTP